MIETEFGDYLGQLLARQRLSAAEVARGLNLDPSLVRRWIRNDRVPALESGHVDQIATVLDLTSSDRHDLEAAQIRSLKARHKNQRNLARDHAAVERILRREDYRPIEKINLRATLNHVSVPPADMNVGDGAASLHQINGLVEAAPQLSRVHADTILFTVQGTGSILNNYPDLFQRGVAAVRSALQRGWDMHILWRLNGDPSRSLRLVQSTLNYLGSTGNFQAFYFKRHGLLVPPYDLYIVPGAGAVFAFSATAKDTCDSSICFRKPEHVDRLRAHFERLMEQTKPAMQRYLARDVAEFESLAAATDSKVGDRFSVGDGLSSTTYPLDWYHEASSWARASSLIGADLFQRLEGRQARLKALREQSQAHSFREVCSKRAVERLVAAREYPAEVHPTLVSAPFRPTAQECADHLLNVIDLLESCPRYELAIIDDWEQVLLSPTSWEVKGDHTVLMRTSATNDWGHATTLFVAIAEPLTAAAFRDYFGLLWFRIAPGNRDKGFVIGWLRQQIDRLLEDPQA